MRYYLQFLLLFISFYSATGQNNAAYEPKSLKERLKFYLIDDEAGLSNNTINSIVQDSSGFIWIGTIEGLNRYDGNSFIKYRNNLEDTSSLLNNFVQSMYVDNEEKIWITTDGGLNIYDGETEIFRAYTTRNGLLQNNVNSIIPSPDRTMVLGVYRGGVHFLHADGTFEYLLPKSDKENSLSSDEISSVAMQGDSVLWVGTFNGGLNKVWWKNKEVKKIPFGHQYTFPSATINAIYSDRQGNVWIGSKAGLHVITTASDTLFATSSLKPEMGLSDADVLCFKEDDNGRMWIGTRNGGLNIVNINNFLTGNEYHQFDWFLPREDGESVYNRTISAIMKDKAGNMWLGTSTGVNFVNPAGENVILLVRNAVNTETLAHDRISSLEKEENGAVWIGTDGGGLNLFDPASGRFDHFFHNPQDDASLSNNYILSLKKDSQGRLWAGTYRGGINKLDPHTGICSHYLQGSLSDGSDVRCILEDSKQMMWVGTNQGGLYWYDEERDFFNLIEKTGSMDIRDIQEDKNGGLWLATFGSGICYYIPEKDSLRIFNTDNTPNLPSNIIFSLLQTSENEIWIGTRYGGLVNLNTKSGKAVVYSEKHGLSNNTVTSMVLEDNENIWIGTLNGVSHFHIPSKKITGFSSIEGIRPGELNIGAAIRDINGNLYFGGNKGLIVFDPKTIKGIKTSPPVILTGLKIFNKQVPVTPANKKGILNKSISHQKEIILSYNQTLFSLDFAALSYPFSNRVSYSYILENYNDHWIESGSVGTANFSNIPPGEYTFKVKATVAPGTGNDTFTTLNIIVTPPFWKTWPAYFLYVVLLVLVIYGVLKYYSERIKLRNSLVLEKKQRQLEHDLNEERLRFFTSFSHELKTPLTLILAPIEDLLEKVKITDHKKSLGLVHKNARYLLQLINKLLEFRKSEVGLNQLKLGAHNLNTLLENCFDNYQQLAFKKKILFTFNPPEKAIITFVDLEKVRIIIYNLLSNAFKFTPPNGKIEVTMWTDQSHVFIQIKDSGPGISSAALSSIFNWYYKANDSKKAHGTGIGLALSKRLAELHHGNIHVESKVNEGAAFTLSLPLDQGLSVPLTSTGNLAEQQYIPKIEDLPHTDLLTDTDEFEEKVIHVHEGETKELLLLIDDNPGIIQYLNDLLREHFHILNARDGKKGLEKALKYVPDLIISDIMMPEKNGIDLCKALKRNPATTHIPVIILSVNDTIESLKEGFEEGADQYITKPFNGQLLLTRIKSLLSNRKQLRDYFNTKSNAAVSGEVEKSPLFQREKNFLEALEITILSQIDSNETNVEAIAHAMGMSRTSLYRKIKAVTGQNINEYIRSAKIRKAAKLISENGLNISQAAYEVGFSSVKYFRKLFKEQYGKLPSELNKEEEL